jgi:hypothetical protein
MPAKKQGSRAKRVAGVTPWQSDPVILDRVARTYALWLRHTPTKQGMEITGSSHTVYFGDIERGKQLIRGVTALTILEATEDAIATRNVIAEELWNRLRELEEVTPQALEVHRDGDTEVVEVGSLDRIEQERKIIETLMKNQAAIESLRQVGERAGGGGDTINDNRIQMIGVTDASGIRTLHPATQETIRMLAERTSQT